MDESTSLSALIIDELVGAVDNEDYETICGLLLILFISLDKPRRFLKEAFQFLNDGFDEDD